MNLKLSASSFLALLWNNFWRILAVVVIILGAYFAWNYLQKMDEAPKVVKEETLKDSDKLAKEINVTPSTAKEIQREITTVIQKEPSASYTVPAPNIYIAADKVQEQIKNKDQSLPKEALENSDRTLVVAKEEEQKVDVYKVNLEKKNKIKAGMTKLDGNLYANISYEHDPLQVIYHKQISGGGNKAGYTVMYTLSKW